MASDDLQNDDPEMVPKELDQPVDQVDARGRKLVLIIQSGGTVFLVILFLVILVNCSGHHR